MQTSCPRSRIASTSHSGVCGIVARVAMAATLTAGLIGLTSAYAEQRGGGGRHQDHDSRYSIGLWGDLPYSDMQSDSGISNLVADMNAHRLTFTAHDGDLKAGSGSLCDDQLYHRSRDFFNALDGAAIFTPGDNDWTDCDRPSNGGFSARERLDRERLFFFSTPYSMGRDPILQTVQSEPPCLGVAGPVPCVENRRWSVGRVVFATLNVAGSCNNLCDSAPDPEEYAARNAANIQWLRDTFASARDQRAVAVMLISQANPGWDESDPTRAPLRDPKTLQQTDGQPDGFAEFLIALREETVAFRRPVAYVHGDSHYFRIDKPLLDEKGRRIENFTRVETFGDNAANGNNDVQWIKVDIDARDREVFSYQAMIVPGNRTAVPSPESRH